MQSRWETIRQAATQVRARFAQRPEQVSVNHTHLNVHLIAEDVFRLEARRDGYLPANVHAVLDPGHEAIRIHPSIDDLMMRFLIAHELGHADLEGLHGPIIDRPQHINPDVTGLFEADQDVLRGYNTRERREQEANFFALELLVPAAQLWRDLQENWTENGLVARYGAPIEAIRSQIVNVCLYPPQPSAENVRSSRPISLDAAQQKAVAAPLPTLVLAGPGSGKTRSMIARYRALVEEGVDPRHILVLTFSNKAAEELRGRLLADLPSLAAKQVGNINVFTFHAFGLELIRRYYAHLQLPPDATLLTRGEAYILCKRQIDQLPLAIFKSLNWPAQNLADLVSRVSRAKEELITPDRYVRRLAKEERRRQPAIQQFLSDHRKGEQQKGERRQREIAKLHELGQFYTAYQQLLRDARALDFGDLVMLPVLLLQQSPEVAAEVRQVYHYILVDEYQDINYANGKLVQVLDGGRQQVWAVGDLCQGIYRFRGATAVHVQRFAKSYSRAGQPLFLDRNYRSLRPIVRASDAQIRGAPAAAARSPMLAVRRRPPRRIVQEIVAISEAQELTTIAQMIRRLVAPRIPWRDGRKGQIQYNHRRYQFGDIAVLCRKHEQAAAVAAMLRAHDIPVEYVGKLLDLPICKDLLAICTLMRTGDHSGLLRVLTTDDFQLSQVDIDVLQPDSVAAVGGIWHVLSKYDEVPELSDQGRQTITALAGVVADLNTQHTLWNMLIRYLFHHSQFFRRQLAAASAGDPAALRTVNQVAQLLTLARNTHRSLLVVDDLSPAGFVQYIREMEEAGQASKVPDLKIDIPAVRVMTAHSSKGLEFPVVFIPYLAEGSFPPNPPPSPSVPHLDWLFWGGPVDPKEEERHLCYVAMSRARDRLFLLRSTAYDGETKERSSLLPAEPPWRQRSLLPGADTQAGTPLEERLMPTRGPLPPIPAHELDLYLKCPRRYLYRHVYGLRGRSRVNSRIYRCIRNAIDLALGHREATGNVPNDAEITAIIDLLWQEARLEDAPYPTDQRALVQARVQASVKRIADRTITVEAFAQEAVVQLDEGEVTIYIDQIEQRQDGPVFLLTFAGEPKDDHRREARTILAAHLYQQRYDAAPRVELHYPGLPDPVPVKHRKDTVPSHIAEMNTALHGIKARSFPAAPPDGAHACKSCPFNLICAV